MRLDFYKKSVTLVDTMTHIKIPGNKVVSELPVADVLNLALHDVVAITPANAKREVKINRLKQFAVHGCKCYNCGIEGNRLLITVDNGGSYHADLYHVDGASVRLMNRDHIRPASKGGGNEVWNMRPACARCNGKRGNHYSKEDQRQHQFGQEWAQWFNRLFRRTNVFKRVIAEIIPLKKRYAIAHWMAMHFSKYARRKPNCVVV